MLGKANYKIKQNKTNKNLWLPGLRRVKKKAKEQVAMWQIDGMNLMVT